MLAPAQSWGHHASRCSPLDGAPDRLWSELVLPWGDVFSGGQRRGVNVCMVFCFSARLPIPSVWNYFLSDLWKLFPFLTSFLTSLFYGAVVIVEATYRYLAK